MKTPILALALLLGAVGSARAQAVPAEAGALVSIDIFQSLQLGVEGWTDFGSLPLRGTVPIVLNAANPSTGQSAARFTAEGTRSSSIMVSYPASVVLTSS